MYMKSLIRDQNKTSYENENLDLQNGSMAKENKELEVMLEIQTKEIEDLIISSQNQIE